MQDDVSSRFRVVEWDDYIGQPKLKKRLEIHINGALKRAAPRLDNIFLHGPPGCGKTTLAGIIANKFRKPVYKFIMPVSDRTLRRLVTELDGVVLFDEIHRSPKKQQESLLTLIEDGYYQPPNGHKIHNQHTTYIGATTERDKVITPLYDRFPIKPEFEPYSDEDMAQIALGMMDMAGLQVPDQADFAFKLGAAAGGLPRNLPAMVNMAIDLQETNHEATIEQILHFCSVTHDGLTDQHVKYLQLLERNGNPVGLSMLATHLQLGQATVLELERLLVRRGWIDYAKSGRDLTTKGHARVLELAGKDQQWQ